MEPVFVYGMFGLMFSLVFVLCVGAFVMNIVRG